MAKIQGKIGLVTSTSSAIGEARAQRLAAAGYKVYAPVCGAPPRQSFEMLPVDVTSNA